MHGDLGQGAREQALRAFRAGKVDVLIATDVAGRGIDIEGVTHVINFQCPEDDGTYVHRIGRTGRAGREGVAITLVDWDEEPRWKLISDTLGLDIPEPVETYSTSEHLFADLGIPAGSTGRLPLAKRTRAGLSAEPEEDLGGSKGRGRRPHRGGVKTGVVTGRRRPAAHDRRRQRRAQAAAPPAAQPGRREPAGRAGRRDHEHLAGHLAGQPVRPAGAPAAAQPRRRRRAGRDTERERNSAFGRLTPRDAPHRGRGRARRGHANRTSGSRRALPLHPQAGRARRGAHRGRRAGRRAPRVAVQRHPRDVVADLRRPGALTGRADGVPALARRVVAGDEPGHAASRSTVGPAVVTGNGGEVAGRDPVSGKVRWRYTRDLPLCTLAAAWSMAVAVYEKTDNLLPAGDPRAAGGCSEVTALDPATGKRGKQPQPGEERDKPDGGQRNSDAELGTRLLFDGSYVDDHRRPAADDVALGPGADHGVRPGAGAGEPRTSSRAPDASTTRSRSCRAGSRSSRTARTTTTTGSPCTARPATTTRRSPRSWPASGSPNGARVVAMTDQCRLNPDDEEDVQQCTAVVAPDPARLLVLNEKGEQVAELPAVTGPG